MDNLPLEERKFLFEKEIGEKKIELQKIELEIRKLEIKSKVQSDKKALRTISPVTATIIVAIITFLGSSLGTFLQGINTNKLEREKFLNSSKVEKDKFQTSLINKALEGQTIDERVNFLNFLTAIKLIDDTALANRINTFITKTPEKIPYNSTASNEANEQWLIIAGAVDSLLDAKKKVNELKKLNLNINIYKKGDKYRIVFGPFLSNYEAKSSMPFVNENINGTAYGPVRMSTWCSNPTIATDYIECK